MLRIDSSAYVCSITHEATSIGNPTYIALKVL
ncbi:hypothetical protein APH_0959 [Anaplasma phagocytophilum str. HZ]|uniref:Uncharacterized protein n=1 Tax=Anaplasma phagocytophilum (strain HZ) TaxID=212042 RepID=Q2GJC4_ANAPZ|nr:hypothetical protein APH_0959 [Anaplasma phagocytophilum str. HZ]